MSRLQHVKSIQWWQYARRSNSEWLRSLCALSADELLFACGDGSLRALLLQWLHIGQLVAREPTALPNVYRVAFDTRTDTLILLAFAYEKWQWQLVSLRPDASEWREVQRLNTSLLAYHSLDNVVMAVCDSRVLLGGGGASATLYAFDVSAAHTLSAAGSVKIERAGMGGAFIGRPVPFPLPSPLVG